MCSHITFETKHYYVHIARHEEDVDGMSIRFYCHCAHCKPESSAFVYDNIQCILGLAGEFANATDLIHELIVSTYHQGDAVAILAYMNKCSGLVVLMQMPTSDVNTVIIELWWALNETKMRNFSQRRNEKFCMFVTYKK